MFQNKVWEYLYYTEDNRRDILKFYNRTEESVQADILSIKNSIEKQPHLPKILDDVRIEKFLILSKFSIEKAKNKIEMYFMLRSYHSDLFQLMDPLSPRIQAAMKTMVALPLKNLTDKLQRVFLFTFTETDRKEDYDAVGLFLYIMCIVEVRLIYEYRASEIQICDLKNTKFSLMGNLSPMFMKTSLNIIQKMFGSKVDKVIFINTPPLLEKIINLLKSFLKPKIASRVEVYKDMESLYAAIPKKILPKEYGGDDESMYTMQDAWNKKIIEILPWINTLKNVQIDEKLRPEKLNDEFLGFQGNFRKLDID